MIAVELYNSEDEVSQIYNNETPTLLNKGYKVSDLYGYSVIYRDRVTKEVHGYTLVYYPTHIIIILDKSIVIVYSLYNYQDTIKWMKEIINH